MRDFKIDHKFQEVKRPKSRVPKNHSISNIISDPNKSMVNKRQAKWNQIRFFSIPNWSQRMGTNPFERNLRLSHYMRS